MATQLEEERASVPSVKFRTPGDQVVGMVVDRFEAPLTEYRADGSQGPQLISKTTGKPRTQEVLTVIVLDGTTATVGDGPVAVGSIARLWIKGHNRWAYIEAKRDHGALCVGDVIRQRFVKTEPGQGGNEKKVTDFGFRKPKPDEAPLVARAEDERAALKGNVLDAAPAAASGPVTQTSQATSVDDF